MQAWTTCPGCGLKHSRRGEPCPRCGTRAPSGGAPSSPTGGPPKPPPAKEAARRRSSLGSWAWLVLGAILIGGVSAAARGCARKATPYIHWRDPELLKQEAWAGRDRMALERILQGMEPLREQEAELRSTFANRSGLVDRAVIALGSEATVLERPPDRSRGRWRTTSVRVAAGRDPSGLLDALEKLPVPEGAWVEAVRCDAKGCSVLLSAATFEQRPPPSPSRSSPALPPRPWWPPSATVWDRLQAAKQENDRLTREVDALVPLKHLQEDVALLDFVVATMLSEEHRSMIRTMAATVRSSGPVDLEVRREQGGLVVEVAGPSTVLSDRLSVLGRVQLQQGSASRAAYLVLPFRNRGSYPDSALPPGFTSGP